MVDKMKLFWPVVLLVFPLLAYVVFGYCFYVEHMDNMVKNEKARVEKVYAEFASEMLNASDEEKAKWLLPAREKGKRWNKDMRIDKHYWGWVPKDEKSVMVWIMANETSSKSEDVYVCTRPIEKEVGYRFIVVTYGALIILPLLAASTWFGIRNLNLSMKEKARFTDAALHDLAIPLSNLAVIADIVEDDDLKINVKRLQNIIENMRMWVKEGRELPLCMKRTDLAKAFDHAHAFFVEEFKFHSGGCDIDVVKEGDSFMVNADETRLDQILWNLLSNEVKYAAHEGSVKVVISEKETCVAISFADVGVGLSTKDMKKVFRPYYRARDLMISGKGGTGLGLSNALGLARMMGGDLTVKANNPKGCVFTLTLPKA